MKKDLFFLRLVKRGVAMLILTTTLTVTEANCANQANVPGTECSVCGDESDMAEIDDPHPKPTIGGC